MSIDGTTIPHTEPQPTRQPHHRHQKKMTQQYPIAKKNKIGMPLMFSRSYDRTYQRSDSAQAQKNHEPSLLVIINRINSNGRMKTTECWFSKMETETWSSTNNKYMITLNTNSPSTTSNCGNEITHSQIIEILVDVLPNSVNILLHSEKINVSILYHEHHGGCRTDCYGHEKIIPDESFVTAAVGDLNSYFADYRSFDQKLNLRCEKSTTSEQLENFLKVLSSRLSSRSIPLQVERFDIEVDSQNQVLMILPFLDTKTLRNIFIINKVGSQGRLEIDELAKLEQWKNAEDIHIQGFINSDDLMNKIKI